MKPLIILVHYISIGNKSPQSTRQKIDEYKKGLEASDDHYNYRHFVLPIKEGSSRIECILGPYFHTK
jgi:hypothetical protein